MKKEIKDFPNYFITDRGKIISKKFKKPFFMKTWRQKSGYENIKLCKNNITYHFLIHRLVAEAFIPNPLNLPEINHKNGVPFDNRIENLEWCDRKTNLYQSYKTKSPIRNFRPCEIIDVDTNKSIRKFQSASSACRYAAKFLGCNYNSFRRYLKNKNYIIKFLEV